MAMSLAFHIVFASIGVAMPVIMVAAEVLGLRRRDPEYLDLARRWAKGTAVLFAIGAVSGTVLSFELGLLFPGFMAHAGAIVGIPFSLEGFAFFTEAIFLGIYLYGWDKIPPRWHVASGVVVAVSGLASAAFVTLVNAWMNTPRGFRLVDGAIVDIDPLAAMATPHACHEVPHTALASYMATGFAVAGIHAFALLRRPGRSMHRKALGLALGLAVPAALAQPLVGHVAGQNVAVHQPAKLAAMEGLQQTTAHAPLSIGPIEVPGLLSFLAFGDTSAVVKGLDDVPADQRPPSLIRPAYQIMIGVGTALAAFSAFIVGAALLRRRVFDARAFLRAVVIASPWAFVAMEAGWVVTEVGRQPWIVYGVIRTAAAVTPVSGLGPRLIVFALVYLVLGAMVVTIVARHVRASLAPDGAPAP